MPSLHHMGCVYNFITDLCKSYDVPDILEPFVDRSITSERHTHASLDPKLVEELQETLRDPSTLTTVWLYAAKCFINLRNRFKGMHGLYPMTPKSGNPYHDIGLIRACAVLAMTHHGTVRDICPLQWHIFYMEQWKQAASAADTGTFTYITQPILWIMCHFMSHNENTTTTITLATNISKHKSKITNTRFLELIAYYVSYNVPLAIIYQNAL